jgi:DMSO/TMAO reductase YedYZ molybdopterin-dependent catalytic subunit
MTPRSLRLALLAAFAVLLTTAAVAVASTRTHQRPAHHPPKSACAVFRINGKVANPLRLHVADLKSYPAHDVDVTFQAGTTPQTHHYTGALLTDVLATAQPRFDPAVKNNQLTFWVEATGSDDYSALVSYGEIDPGFGAKQVLLAYAEDGNDLCTAGPRLVVPGDIKGGRYVSNIVRVRVGSASHWG